MSVNLINKWFKHRAEKDLGIIATEFFWSLSHCQGDGVAFETSALDHDEILSLIEPCISVLQYEQAKAWLEDLDLTIRFKSDNRYPILMMDWEYGNYDCYPPCEGDFEGCQSSYEHQMDELAELITESAQETGKSFADELEREGYKLLDALSGEYDGFVAEFSGQNFVVKVYEDACEDMPIDLYDEENLIAMAQDLIHGRLRGFDLRVEIEATDDEGYETGETLGIACLGGIIEKHDAAPGGEMLLEILDKAAESLSNQEAILATVQEQLNQQTAVKLAA